MKLIKLGSFFSKASRSKKRDRIESPSFGSVATTTSSSSEGTITPKSVLPVAIDDLFSVFDRDGDGKISKPDLQAVLGRLGPHDPPTEEELASMVAEIDRDGDGYISLDELGVIALAALEKPAAGDELREAFAVFDVDGDGEISAGGLCSARVFAVMELLGGALDLCEACFLFKISLGFVVVVLVFAREVFVSSLCYCSIDKVAVSYCFSLGLSLPCWFSWFSV
ncbi:probable calcium-binding protein CML36 [Phalaenopsis equestris]|uniref:probable calcium-binding protein CML36 n=1 Tax=Phalaenopsis equestris TaxID=78828 RepID=UPI0009E1C0AF|nr:probable calcium-binding protein CML36 [Phalaenopsis equestris]